MQARGEFIQYLDSDDVLLPRKLMEQVEVLRLRPECGVAYCRTRRVSSTGAESFSHRTAESFDHLFPEFLHRRGWHTVSPLWRRSACAMIGPWPSLRVMEDWVYDCRAGVLGIRPAYVPETLCEVRDHAGPRASGGVQGFSHKQWVDYLSAHEQVLDSLEAANQAHHLHAVPFARNLFRCSRACAQQGYVDQARRAYRLASQITVGLTDRAKLSVFRGLTLMIGWQAAANVVERGWEMMASSRRFAQ
jgi:hypothetical protein